MDMSPLIYSTYNHPREGGPGAPSQPPSLLPGDHLPKRAEFRNARICCHIALRNHRVVVKTFITLGKRKPSIFDLLCVVGRYLILLLFSSAKIVDELSLPSFIKNFVVSYNVCLGFPIVSHMLGA